MADEKKSKRNIIIIVVAVLLLLGAIGSCTGGGNKSSSSTASSQSASSSTAAEQSSSAASESASSSVEAEPAAEQSEPATPAIELVAGEQGEYGQELVLNAGTEFEERNIVYYLPAGDYSVKNVGDYRTQASVYEGVQTNEDGWEEPANTGDILMLDAGQTGDLNVPDGWYIEIQEPTHIELTPKA